MTAATNDALYQDTFFQNFFRKSSQSLVLRADPPHFTILAVSDEYLHITHTQREDLLNRRVFDVFPGSRGNAGERYSVEQSFHRVIESRQTDKIPVFPYEIYLVETGRKETFYWSNSNEPILDDAGNVAYIVNTTCNVTDEVVQQEAEHHFKAIQQLLENEKQLNHRLQQSQEALQQLNSELEDRILHRTEGLRQNEAKFQNMVKQAPVAIATFMGPQFVIDLYNDRVLEFWGRTAEQVVGLPLFTALPEAAGQGFEELLTQVYTTGERFVAYEMPATLLRNGELVNTRINFSYEAIHDEDGIINGIMVVCLEVTEQVEARVKLQQARQLLETAAEAGGIGIYVIDRENNTLTASPQMKEIFGFPPNEELPFEAAVDQITDEYRQHIRNRVAESFATGAPYAEEYTINRHRDGAVRWIRALGKVDSSTVENKTFFSGALIDITEQVEAREAGQRMNKELSAINGEMVIANAELLLVQNELLDANKYLLESEERFRTMAEGTDVFISLGDETGNAVYFNGIWSETTGKSNPELMKSGWADLLHPDDRELAVNTYKNAVANKTSFTNEFRILTKEGKYIWLFVQGILRVHSDGSFAGHIGSAFDITERKQDDQRKSDFISMVSHELKTPLTSMGGYVQILRARAGKDGDALAATLLDKAHNQVKRMTTLINGFLNMARLESGKIHIDSQRFDMATLMKETEEEANTIIFNHKIIFEPAEEIFVLADRDKIGQVINNFISNAGKYSPMGTTIRVACAAKDGKATVTVKDQGMGVAPQDKDKIFDRFYRVQGATMGSIAGFGIGLYLCAEIIHRHGGEIGVDSEPGKGSRFYFTLPVVA